MQTKKPKVFLQWNGEDSIRVRLLSGHEKVLFVKNDVFEAEYDRARGLKGLYKKFQILDAENLEVKDLNKIKKVKEQENKEKEKLDEEKEKDIKKAQKEDKKKEEIGKPVVEIHQKKKEKELDKDSDDDDEEIQK